MTIVSDEVSSPCISECELDDEGICKGCYRSVDDIVSWRTMGNDERLAANERAKRRQSLIQFR